MFSSNKYFIVPQMPHIWIFSYWTRNKTFTRLRRHRVGRIKRPLMPFRHLLLAVNWAFVGRETSHLRGLCHLLIRTTGSIRLNGILFSLRIQGKKLLLPLDIQLICIFICELSFGSKRQPTGSYGKLIFQWAEWHIDQCFLPTKMNQS
jgi:hypothetical protein